MPLAEYVPLAPAQVGQPVPCGNWAAAGICAGSIRLNGITFPGKGKHIPLLWHDKKSQSTLNPENVSEKSPSIAGRRGSESVACHVPLAGLIWITALPPSPAATIEKGMAVGRMSKLTLKVPAMSIAEAVAGADVGG